MLVLTRKQQEKVRIGDDIVITVLRMKGKAVRLGIEAPGSIPVLRGELVFEEADEAESLVLPRPKSCRNWLNRPAPCGRCSIIVSLRCELRR